MTPSSGAAQPGSLTRSGLAMAAGTIASRATGLVRTAALAGALGVTSLADAYNIANTLPTILLVLVTGGTLSSVLIPLLVATEGEERRVTAGSLGSLVVWVTAGAALLAVATSPVLARLFALGLRGDPGYDDFVRQTTLFLVLFAPQVVAYGVSVHAVAVLNAGGRLALGAFASVATNVVTVAAIGAYLLLRPDDGTPDDLALLVLGLGTTLGVVAMAALQSWGAHRQVPGLRIVARPRHDATTGRVLALGRWTVLYVVANQVGLAVVLTVAAGVRGASAYQWSFAIMQLPYAVVAVSVLSALFPRLSRAAAADPAAYAEQLSRGLRLLLALLLPAAVLLVALARPLTQLLLGYGAVDGEGVDLITAGVRTFGLALLPFTFFQLLTRACYARGDTRNPAVVNIAVNLVNVVGALAAVALPSRSATLVGLAGAFAGSYVVGCVLLTRRLRRTAPTVFQDAPGTTVRLLLAGGLAVAAAGLGGVAGSGWWLERDVPAALLQTAVVGTVTLTVYAVTVSRLVPGLLPVPRRRGR